MKLSSFNLFFIFMLISILFIACNKEEEEIDTCKDGVLSPGEEDVDCGGPCPPCSTGPSTIALAIINSNEEVTQFSNYVLERYDDWILNFYNDSINVTINLGDGDSLGTRPLKANYSKGRYRLIDYHILKEGRCLFTNIDHENKKLSFFFEAKFTIDPGHPNYNSLDTLFIRNGDFENISWLE